MVVAVLLATMLAPAHSARADAGPTSENGAVARERKHAKRLEHVGAWFTGFGMGHAAVGGVVLPIGLQMTPSRNTNIRADYIATGGGILGVGVVLLAIGIPLWVVGHRRLVRLPQLAAPLPPDPGVVMRF